MKLGDLKDGELIPHELDKPSETSELRHIDEDVTKSNELIKKGEARLVKERTKNENFRITPAMIAWIDTAVKLVTDSPTDISPLCHVSRESWYRWLRIPGFEDWFYEQYKAKRYRWLPRLDAMGMLRAPKNFDYWQAMNRKAGELLEDGEHQARTVVSILGGMTVQTINNIKQDTTTKEQDT